MDRAALTALEYPEILSLLRAETATPAGAALASELLPVPDAPTVLREVALTEEALHHLERRGHLPFGSVPDVVPHLERLSVGGTVLAPLEVLDLVALIKTGRDLKASLNECRAEFPGLWGESRALPDLGNLVRFLDGKIAPSGEIEDHASDDLRQLRQDLRRSGERLQAMLREILSRPGATRAIQDDFVSIRSDRHVLPVKSEAREAIPGIVHGISGTGATLFIEPIETVELNNDRVTIRDREQAEVRRLLHEYSDLLRGRLPEIRSLVSAVGRLDLLMAKARLGRALSGVPASASPDGRIHVRGARHPLVEGNLRAHGGRIVPLDLTMPPGIRVLIVSGPNTGGKTVTLKTVGILAAMFQSGLLVPADEAVLPVFRGIFIDIGDRQSIPEGLSTFSARIKTVAGIAAQIEPPSLALLDEVGSGTDPEEGVALAVAILDHFRTLGACVIGTTHMEPVKAFAATTEGCTNAAMQFDEATLTPTYRLIPGIPGRSGALEIAERLGLPPAILQEAQRRRGRSGEMIGGYLARLREMSEDLARRLAAVDEERRGLERDRSALESRAREREEEQRRSAAKAIEDALQTLRQEGERYLASLRDRDLQIRMRREEEKAAVALRAEARRQIRQVAGTSTPAPRGAGLRVGDRVRVEGTDHRGAVQALLGDRVVIEVRGKRLTVPRTSLLPEPGVARTGGPPRLPHGVTLERRPLGAAQDEIHLRGQRVEEALEALDKYLDDAYLAGLSPVRLVHGLGTGRLKQAILDLLGRHPHVDRFADAPADQGGGGVTVVTLRI